MPDKIGAAPTDLWSTLKSIATERDIEEWWRKINTPMSDIGSKVGRWLDEPSLRDQTHPAAPYLKGFASGIAESTLDGMTSPMGAVLTALPATRAVKRGYDKLLNVGEPVAGSIAADPFALSEAPMDRRSFFYRATPLPQKAAEARAAQAPNVITNVANSLRDDMPIMERGKVLGRLEEEARMLDVLHEKHGVLNKTLPSGKRRGYVVSQGEGWDINNVTTDKFSDDALLDNPWSAESEGVAAGGNGVIGTEIPGANNQISSLLEKVGDSTKKKYAGTLARLSRGVPRKIMIQGDMPKEVLSELEAMERAYEMGREKLSKVNQAMSRAAEKEQEKIAQSRHGMSMQDLVNTVRQAESEENQYLSQAVRRYKAEGLNEDAAYRKAVPETEPFREEIQDLYDKIGRIRQESYHNPRLQRFKGIRDDRSSKFAELNKQRDQLNHQLQKNARRIENVPPTDPKKFLEGALKKYDDEIISRREFEERLKNSRNPGITSSEIDASRKNNQRIVDEATQDLLSAAAQIGGPYGDVARAIVQAKLAPRQIMNDASEAVINGVARGYMRRFGINPETFDEAKNVVKAGQNVVDEMQPENIAAQLKNIIMRKFGMKKIRGEE